MPSGGQKDAENERITPQAVSVPELAQIQAAKNQHSADTKNAQDRERLRMWLEGFGLLALIGTLAATTKSTCVLQQQVYSGQRAYVLVQQIDSKDLILEAPLTIGQRVQTYYSFRNTGDTPANNVRISNSMVLRPSQPLSLPPATSQEQSALSLGADESRLSWGINLEGGRLWTAADAARLKKGERIYALVTLTYDTVFNTVKGETNFCVYYAGAEDPRFWPCETGGNKIH
jgi:hypothetical protein